MMAKVFHHHFMPALLHYVPYNKNEQKFFIRAEEFLNEDSSLTLKFHVDLVLLKVKIFQEDMKELV